MKKTSISTEDQKALSFEDKLNAVDNTEPFEVAKAQFLSRISHELRTPLSVIKLKVEAIEDGMYQDNAKAFVQLREKLQEFERLMDEMTRAK